MAIPMFQKREVVAGSAPDLPFDFTYDDDNTPRDVSGDTVVLSVYSDGAARTLLFPAVTATNDGTLTNRKIVTLTTSNTAQANIGAYYAELDRKVAGVVKERWVGTLVIAGPR